MSTATTIESNDFEEEALYYAEVILGGNWPQYEHKLVNNVSTNEVAIKRYYGAVFGYKTRWPALEHKLLDDIYSEVQDSIDTFAENIRKIGAYTPAISVCSTL